MSRTPLPSVSYNRNMTGIGILISTLVGNGNFVNTNCDFTFKFVFRTASLQQGQVADDVLERDTERIDVQ